MLLQIQIEVAAGGVGRVLQRVDRLCDVAVDLALLDGAHLGADRAAVGNDVGGGASGDHADVRRRLCVEAPLWHVGDRVCRGNDRVHALLGLESCVGGLAADLGIDAHLRGRGRDDLAERRGVIEDVAEAAAADGCTSKSPGTVEARLLGNGEQQLDAQLRSRVVRRQQPRQLEHRRDRRLVVGSEDPLVGVLPAAVATDRLDRAPSAAPCPCGAQNSSVRSLLPGIRASRLPALEPTAAPASSSSTSIPSAVNSRVTQSATPRSVTGRAGDPAERLERAVQSLAFGLGDRDHPASASWLAVACGRDLSESRVAVTSSSCPSGSTSESRARCAIGRADELPEQRRGPVRAGLELGVELRGHVEGMHLARKLRDLDQAPVRGRPREHQAGRLELLLEVVVHLVAVAVALIDDALAVCLVGPRARVRP